MRRKIFEKAKYLLTKTKLISEGEYSISFFCNEYHVVAKYQNHKLIWLCDCQAGANVVLCAHKVACQSFLVYDGDKWCYNVSGERLHYLGSEGSGCPNCINFLNHNLLPETTGEIPPEPLSALSKVQETNATGNRLINDVPEEISGTACGLDHLTEAQKYVLRQMVCFTCQDCKRHEDICGKLQVHRKKRGEHGGKYTPDNTDIICNDCHDMRD
jgi:hypothetical protein